MANAVAQKPLTEEEKVRYAICGKIVGLASECSLPVPSTISVIHGETSETSVLVLFKTPATARRFEDYVRTVQIASGLARVKIDVRDSRSVDSHAAPSARC